MSATATSPAKGHIHLPSVHIRNEDGTGFDYEEDFYVTGRGRQRRVDRVVTLIAFQDGVVILERETRDTLRPDELEQLEESLPILMEEGNVSAEAAMQECAQMEYERQLRIALGVEVACRACGCSETR